MTDLDKSSMGLWKRWWALLQLRYQIWSSKRFEAYCLKIDCRNIAELEQDYRALMENEIARLKAEAKPEKPPVDLSKGFVRKSSPNGL